MKPQFFKLVFIFLVFSIYGIPLFSSPKTCINPLNRVFGHLYQPHHKPLTPANSCFDNTRVDYNQHAKVERLKIKGDLKRTARDREMRGIEQKKHFSDYDLATQLHIQKLFELSRGRIEVAFLEITLDTDEIVLKPHFTSNISGGIFDADVQFSVYDGLKDFKESKSLNKIKRIRLFHNHPRDGWPRLSDNDIRFADKFLSIYDLQDMNIEIEIIALPNAYRSRGVAYSHTARATSTPIYESSRVGLRDRRRG